MEPSDFVLVIVPLSIVVATLTAMVYYYAHKDEINSRKNAKLVQAFIDKRMKQQAAIRDELQHIETLYRNRNIDKGTYQSMKNVILMSQERQRFEAITTFTEKNKDLNREGLPPETPIAPEEQDACTEKETSTEEPQESPSKEVPTQKPRQKRANAARKTKPRRKKETEIGLINSASLGEEALNVSAT